MSRSVLITGGSRGIGLAIAHAFAQAGDQVAVTFHSSPAPEGLLGVKCDVTSPGSIDEAFSAVEAQHGPVQVLVTAAGITRDRTLMAMKDDDLTRVIDTNLNGAIFAARRAVPRMRSAGFGRIILISSVIGRMGAKGQTNYAASKAGLQGAAVSMSRELGPKGITTNVVAPGLIATEMASTIPPAQLQAMVQAIPVGRIGQPHDIARAVLFIADNDSGYINGAYLAVDGGAATGH